MHSSLPSLALLLITLGAGALDARASGRLFVNSGTADVQELDPITGAVISTTTISGWSGAPIAAADIKHYQCWYRDSVAFCSGDTFNLTQGVTLTWGP